MIYLGESMGQRRNRVMGLRDQFEQIYVISPAEFALNLSGVEDISYEAAITYKVFYRLLRELNNDCLLVINECIRDRHRSALTYNCIRQFVQHTKNVIAFQYMPFIFAPGDFMILVDFVTRSKYRMEQEYDPEMEVDFSDDAGAFGIDVVAVEVSAKTLQRYQTEKQKRFDEIGNGDPHTIPRNLALISGRDKLPAVENSELSQFVARNRRIKHPKLVTYRDAVSRDCGVFDFSHSHKDFSDFMLRSEQTKPQALVSDLPVDQWYLNQYNEWMTIANERIKSHAQ